MTRVLEWGLRAWAVVQIVVALLWIIGPYGTGNFYGSDVPGGPGGFFEQTLLTGMFTGPIIAANLTEPGALDKLFDLSQELTGYQGGEVQAAFGDINAGWSVQFSVMTGAQNAAWIALHVVPLLVMAALWWLLAGVVAQSRGETVFTSGNATRLRLAGGVILVGAPLHSVLTWWFYNWVADSSQIADRIAVPSYSWGHLPWTAIAAGAVLVSLGQVWHRGVSVENELSGLV